jgi:dTDP-4-amino-4,6-dideoxygalactose transaminase
MVKHKRLLEMSTTTGLTIPFTGLRKQYNALRDQVLNATDEVLRSGVLMNGNNTAEFEHWLAKKNRSKYAVTCHSGTHALEIIAEYWASQLTLHPKVFMPSFTYVATANAFIRAGWDIHFIDTDAYGIIDDTKFPQGVDYDAVVLVGLYGKSITHSAHVRSWNHWVATNTIVIEDAAQHWLANSCQRIGDAAAISFDPMKNLACYGNGGAVVTDNSDLAEFARAWRDNGKPTHNYAGTNSRMSEIDCATMLIKTQHIDRWQARRAQISDFWRERFAKNSKIRCLIDENNAHNHAHHKFVIDIDNRNAVKQKLADLKIETRVHYERPIHEIDVYRQWPGPDMLAVSSSLARRVLSLPLYPELTDLEVEYISDQVLSCVA